MPSWAPDSWNDSVRCARGRTSRRPPVGRWRRRCCVPVRSARTRRRRTPRFPRSAATNASRLSRVDEAHRSLTRWAPGRGPAAYGGFGVGRLAGEAARCRRAGDPGPRRVPAARDPFRSATRSRHQCVAVPTVPPTGRPAGHQPAAADGPRRIPPRTARRAPPCRAVRRACGADVGAGAAHAGGDVVEQVLHAAAGRVQPHPRGRDALLEQRLAGPVERAVAGGARGDRALGRHAVALLVRPVRRGRACRSPGDS